MQPNRPPGKKFQSIRKQMQNKYTLSDSMSYLSGSIIMFEGVPVLVDFQSDQALLVDPVTRNTIAKEPIENLDIQPPEVGYFNYFIEDHTGVKVMRAFYAYRTPIKNWKQGLTTNNTTIRSVDNGDGLSPHAIYSEGFKEGLLDRYPTYSEAIQKLNDTSGEKYESVAISKDIAIMRRDSGVTLVFLRMKEVGFLDVNGTINVPNSKIGWIIDRHLLRVDWKVSNMSAEAAHAAGM